MAKAKRMTNAQKKYNADFKKRMQAEGILPPDKPRLNRKKFVEGARQEWNGRDGDCYAWDYFLSKGISIMLGHTDKGRSVHPEAVGVAKALKLAIRLKQFSDRLKSEGRSTYALKEQYEFIKDIIDA